MGFTDFLEAKKGTTDKSALKLDLEYWNNKSFNNGWDGYCDSKPYTGNPIVFYDLEGKPFYLTQCEGTRVHNGVTLSVFMRNGIIYLYDDKNDRTYYIDEDDKIQRYWKPVVVTANKNKGLLLIAGICLLFCIK